MSDGDFVVSYEPGGAVSESFLLSDAFIRGIKGPIGSGKSVACCNEIIVRGCEQEPGRDGVRRTRWAAVRNTYPELKSTTIETWLDWFPEDVFGKMRWDVPITHCIEFVGDDGIPVEITVWFLALDKPAHVKKLLSLEVTGIWFNEAKFAPKALIDAGSGRVGRFPSMKDKPDHIPKERWPTWCGIIMDTNPPDDDHWWYELAEETSPEMQEEIDRLAAELHRMGVLREGQRLFEFFDQPSGLSDDAENIKNLRVGYYQFAAAGKTKDWVDVYVHGKYGSTLDGKPVYPEYNDALHYSDAPLPPIRGLPLILGFDFGLTPACVIGQLSPRGQIRVIDELIGTSIGIGNFCTQVVVPHLRMYYPDWRLDRTARRDDNYIEAVGDPAGIAREGDEKDSFQRVLEAGITIVPARTNYFQPRRESVADPMSRLLDGMPGFVIGPKCKVLRKGFKGSYRYRRLQVAGEERYTDEPDKNSYSHPHDALQYLCLKFALPQTQRSRPQTGYAPLDRTIGL